MYLVLENNEITEINPEVCKITSLKLLNFSLNAIKEIPKDIINLQKLYVFYFDEKINYDILYKIKNLTYVYQVIKQKSYTKQNKLTIVSRLYLI